MSEYRHNLGWPLRDAILTFTAAFVAFGIILVASDGNAVAATAGGMIGALWFTLGCIYGYGEAVGV